MKFYTKKEILKILLQCRTKQEVEIAMDIFLSIGDNPEEVLAITKKIKDVLDAHPFIASVCKPLLHFASLNRIDKL